MKAHPDLRTLGFGTISVFENYPPAWLSGLLARLFGHGLCLTAASTAHLGAEMEEIRIIYDS